VKRNSGDLTHKKVNSKTKKRAERSFSIKLKLEFFRLHFFRDFLYVVSFFIILTNQTEPNTPTEGREVSFWPVASSPNWFRSLASSDVSQKAASSIFKSKPQENTSQTNWKPGQNETNEKKRRLKNQTQTGFYFGSGLGQLFKPRMEKVNNNNWPVSWHHYHCVCECVCVPRHVQWTWLEN